jgi:MOSC domain-containing protein YiiM
VFEGRIVGIYTAPAKGALMQHHDEIEAVAGLGLAGDRYADAVGKYSGTRRPDHERAVTLIEREAVTAVQADSGTELGEDETRRNLVTEDVPLNHLVGRTFRVGSVTMRGVDLAEPCAYLESLTRRGVCDALVHRGGLRAEILIGGRIRVGDVVTDVGGGIGV